MTVVGVNMLYCTLLELCQFELIDIFFKSFDSHILSTGVVDTANHLQ